MDIKQIRRANFEVLLAQYLGAAPAGEKRTLRSFATMTGMNEVHLSQIKNGHRDIGTRVARKLEKKMQPSLPDDWMDREHRDADPRNLAEQELVTLLLELFRDAPTVTSRALRKLKSERKAVNGKKKKD